jgi:hypothetical protein
MLYLSAAFAVVLLFATNYDFLQKVHLIVERIVAALQ